MNTQSHAGSPKEDDGFSGMAALKSGNTVNVTKNSTVESVNNSKVTKSHTHKSDTSTKNYIGKKITDTNWQHNKEKLSDTTLTAISIDTDYSIKAPKKNAVSLDTGIVQTSIDSLDFRNHKVNSASERFPIVIEEMPDQKPFPVITNSFQAKKDKPFSSQQNISLDITSDFLNIQLPSGNQRESLGSGNITDILGSGGMARVYKIWNEKLEVYRAVKILLPTNNRASWDRFHTEAKISAKLHHPNIIEIHDTGEWHGLPFIEMELVNGETLDALLSHYKPLPSIVCSAIALQVARALSYAHCEDILIYGKVYNGIIHRDLKPSNIMISPNGVVKLMDFGVARPAETGLHTVEADHLIGTMHYFSPEQINGYPIDQLSDIYSFGAVLYELLSGQMLFPQCEMINLIQAKAKNQFERLDFFEILMDPRLASVAQTCLRTVKTGRFQSAKLLVEQLEMIHSSYGMGTPEKVIEQFVNNPELLYNMSEQWCLTYTASAQSCMSLTEGEKSEELGIVNTQVTIESVLPVSPAIDNIVNTEMALKNVLPIVNGKDHINAFTSSRGNYKVIAGVAVVLVAILLIVTGVGAYFTQ